MGCWQCIIAVLWAIGLRLCGLGVSLQMLLQIWIVVAGVPTEGPLAISRQLWVIYSVSGNHFHEEFTYSATINFSTSA